MITNFQFLGIYEEAINHAIEASEKALEMFDIDVEDMHYIALEELKETGSFDDITNSIIRAYFNTTRDIIKQENPNADVDYYVNCTDSHFYVDGCEV